MRRRTTEATTRRRSQPASPAERIYILRTALREGVSKYDIAIACSISVATVAGWEEHGLYGDRSLGEIERLIAENRSRSAKLADMFIETFTSCGLRNNRDLQLAGLPDLLCGPLDTPVNPKTLRRLLLQIGRQSHLTRLRRYVERFHDTMRAEQRREARL